MSETAPRNLGREQGTLDKQTMNNTKRNIELSLTEGEASLIVLSLQHTVPELKSLNSRQELRRVFGDIDLDSSKEEISNKLSSAFGCKLGFEVQ